MKIDKTRFSTLAENWALVERHFNEVYGRVDWSRTDDMFCCRSCYSMLFKEGYLQSQKPSGENVIENEVARPSELTTSPQAPPSVSICYRTRKRFSYETQRDSEDKKQCIICCTAKKDTKGKCIPVKIITSGNVQPKKHNTEETLLKFAKIHLKHQTKYNNTAERILLVAATTSLFAADVGCYLK